MFDHTTRPYDVAFPLDIRAAIRKRRAHPTGEIHAVKYEERGNDVVQLYPWKKMLLGDFFLAKIGNRSARAMKVGFTKAAQRHDLEIVMKRTKDADGDDAIEVVLTMFDISNWRKKASRQHGVNLVIHDREHAKAKRRHREVERPKRKHTKRKRGDAISYPKPESSCVVPDDVPPLEQPLMTIDEMRAYALRPGAGE